MISHDQPSYWDGRLALVTGAGGFIGASLVHTLVGRGARVLALTHYSSRPGYGQLDDLPAEVRDQVAVFAGDVTDPGFMRHAVDGVDAVFHLAALVAIPHSYTSPAAYVATNVGGTLNLLEAVRDTRDVQVMVQMSTSEVYGTAQYTPMDEAHPLHPQSPYAASKVAADALALSYFRSFGAPVAVARPFNTYGPGQSARAIVPTIAAQLLAGRERIQLGALHPIRDLTFVTDTVRGLLAIAETQACIGQVTNLGSGAGIAVGELAWLLAELTGRTGVEIVQDGARIRPVGSEVGELVADARAARDRCGWRSYVQLHDGLALVVEHIRAHPDRYDPARYVT